MFIADNVDPLIRNGNFEKLRNRMICLSQSLRDQLRVSRGSSSKILTERSKLWFLLLQLHLFRPTFGLRDDRLFNRSSYCWQGRIKAMFLQRVRVFFQGVPKFGR